jgi:hypothetical protein
LAGLKASQASLSLLDMPQVASKLLPQVCLLTMDKGAEIRSLALSVLENSVSLLRVRHEILFKAENDKKTSGPIEDSTIGNKSDGADFWSSAAQWASFGWSSASAVSTDTPIKNPSTSQESAPVTPQSIITRKSTNSDSYHSELKNVDHKTINWGDEIDISDNESDDVKLKTNKQSSFGNHDSNVNSYYKGGGGGWDEDDDLDLDDVTPVANKTASVKGVIGNINSLTLDSGNVSMNKVTGDNGFIRVNNSSSSSSPRKATNVNGSSTTTGLSLTSVHSNNNNNSSRGYLSSEGDKLEVTSLSTTTTKGTGISKTTLVKKKAVVKLSVEENEKWDDF